MRILKPSTGRGYMRKHPAARQPLRLWLEVVERAEWQSIADVRRAYGHADPGRVASGRTVRVFDVGGNNYRFVVTIHYNTGKVFIREFLTHAEYDRDTWKGRH